MIIVTELSSPCPAWTCGSQIGDRRAAVISVSCGWDVAYRSATLLKECKAIEKGLCFRGRSLKILVSVA